MFDKLAAADPDIYIIISNGAYLSPWWLIHVDAVWMINAGDAAGGSSRTAELVYRDGRYHEIWQEQNCQYPMCAIFNHEPKKTSTGESKDEFRRYLYMNLSRGTGFVELYIKPFNLQPGDWDVLSEGLFWIRDVFPTFSRSRMHGGAPTAGDVYGYTAWNETQGYITVHNPSEVSTTYSVKLDRTFGLLPGTGPFHVSSPIDDSTRGMPATCELGDTLTIEMQPREIRVLNFSKHPKDWTKLKQLQVRSPETAKIESPIRSVPVKDHAILGTWQYEHNGAAYTRTFTTVGVCTLRQGKNVIWRRPFRVAGPERAIVDGQFDHRLKSDGTLHIEGHYTARRQTDKQE